jgi:3-deoxy-D-manno-octulosonate 8-phosphate phosphatase (KDO 8-P phosphatase)
MSELKSVAKKFEHKLKKIKVFATDVDGVLTDGRIFYSGKEMEFNRFFHALDGYGLKMMMDASS